MLQRRPFVHSVVVFDEVRSGGWLASYPLFTEALHHGETSFRAAPEHVRRVILQRVPRHDTTPDEITVHLKDLGVTFVELCSRTVDEAVQAFLASEGGNASSAPRLDELAAQIPRTVAPLVARPPRLLRPGLGIFLDGWMRFFSYRARRHDHSARRGRLARAVRTIEINRGQDGPSAW
ncbi:hypothetical protein [Paraburkholderia phosphatilytica]|uniref:hypothetical protein n=1 Tax=Paraburkholderia phosphatilytica TaxID=2282883 RepID=UPI0013DFD17F|nr:hypothetical protein [Paraburkholderia phosphatilytica]